MTYLLDDLEAAGLIERHADPADRRARRVVATEHADVLTQLDLRLRAAEERVLDPLGKGERDRFRAQLRRLATRIDALDPIDDPCTLAAHADADPRTPRPAPVRPTRGRR